MAIRRLPLKGLYNARDLGGYPVAGGKQTAFGRFVRSEAPCELGEEDIQALADYGITMSMDLRSLREQSVRPSSLKDLPHMAYCSMPLLREAAIPDGQTKTFRPWGEEYIDMAEGAREWAVEALTLAAERDGAVLYHCTTGKDRTGLMSCYLLSIAGVARADIIADYMVSEVYLEPVYQRLRSGEIPMGIHPDQKFVVGPDFFHTWPEAMSTLLGHFEEHYGGVVPFLREIGGPEEVCSTIRKKFVEKPRRRRKAQTK